MELTARSSGGTDPGFISYVKLVGAEFAKCL
jgi:hypothetical protein